MAYFPMFVNLKDQPCLVVGGGMVAYRKVKVLLDFEARVVVVGENICDKIYEIVKKSNQLELQKKRFEDADCDNMFMVIAATDDKELNHHIAGICNSKGIMVNAVDQKEDCSFIFSSYIKEKNLIAAFSSGGNSPVLAQYLKSQEKEILTPFLGELNEYMGKIRKRVIEKYDAEEKRKEIFKEIVNTAIENGELPQE
ncbi:bifunctional precorrin-2 dehydrogenase/sirohydrochlorin ferrochelatase [Dorea formicigenerans]|uniref:precorrin-2 dehydrogenase n=2 Tax=Dorea formicigenerans TaxID=39486 RepID=A0A848CF34_9FIRM|nr:bifunctional precorrin-2 dehydrogenase/sirohydrochlorin ferrochelatase [Dorea formicigenerans]